MRRITVQLGCDRCGCPRQGRPGQTLEDLRQALVDIGWRSVAADDSDLCPSCAPVEAR